MAPFFDSESSSWRIAAATGAALLAAGGYWWHRGQRGIDTGAKSGSSMSTNERESAAGIAAGQANKATGNAPSAAGAGTGAGASWFGQWSQFYLDASEDEVHGPPDAPFRVVRLRFQLPVHHEGELLPVEAGQSLELRWRNPETGADVVRAYTPIQTPQAGSSLSVPDLPPAKSARRRSLVDHQTRAERTLQPGFFELLVKVHADDPLSTHLAKLVPADHSEWVEMRGPVGGAVTYPRAGQLRVLRGEPRIVNVKHLLLIAGGTGITPMYQILTAVTSNPQDATAVTLIYACRTDKDIPLKSQLDVLRREFSNVTVIYTVEEKRSKDFAGFEGRVSRAMIDAVAPPFAECAAVVCGPRGMELAVESLLKDENFAQGRFPADRIFTVQ